jgi:hypothetical protein
MIFLPWIAFLLGMAYMIWQGFKDKREFFRQQDERERHDASTASGKTPQTAHD